MKILFVLHYPLPVHGSAVVGGYIKDSEMINQAFECHYVNLGTSTSVENIGRNSLGKFFRYFKLLFDVIKQLIIFRPDICYLTPTARGIGFYKDALIIAVVKLFGIRTIFHFHTKGVSTRQTRFVDSILYRIVFKDSQVILLSNCLYPDMKKFVPGSKVHFCANGIPDLKKSLKDQTCIKKHPAKNRPAVNILFLSNLILSKGVFVLIEALKILKEKNLSFHCTMIGGEGDISESQVKSRIKDIGLEHEINVAGKLYGKDKQSALESAEIFVLPTFYFNECMPLAILEAMQNSLPVVSSFEGAIPDIVEDGVTGFLVPQKDVVALADKIEVLIKDPELRKRMGSAGRKKYEREFSLQKFEKRMVEILEDVVTR